VAHVRFAEALVAANRPHDAFAAVTTSLAKFPDHYELLMARAMALSRLARLDEALEQWSDIRRSHPERPAAYSEAATALRLATRYDECEDLIGNGLQKFPNSVGLLAERASLAAAKKDWAHSLADWQIVRSLNPANRGALFGAAEAFLQLGQATEAIEPLDLLLEQTPDHPRATIMRSQADMTLSAWTPAIARLSRASHLHPKNNQLAETLLAARMAAIQEQAEAEEQHDETTEELHLPRGQVAASGASAPIDASAEAALFERFESLGDNCEFGLVQRFYRAEPLGLLRWSSISPPEIISALEKQFDGVGESDTTLLIAGGKEYITRDRNYRMTMHTFIPCDTISHDELLPKMQKRLQFLKRRLLEDLAQGEKMFVYKSIGGIKDEEMAAISDALRAYGNPRILFVKEAGSVEQPGEVTKILPNAYLGFVGRFGHHGGNWNIDFPSWLDLCRNAARVMAAS
jgi:tetratricopeptide (TPR) repeat protein